MIIDEMNEEYALEIYKWTYPVPYNEYNFNEDQNELSQLLNGLHYAAIDEKTKELLGFISIGWSAQPLCKASKKIYEDESFSDLALGLRPDLCGKGLGLDLLYCGVRFLKELFPNDGIRLTVNKKNARAIKTYERAGFITQCSFKSYKNRKTTTFIVMTKL